MMLINYKTLAIKVIVESNTFGQQNEKKFLCFCILAFIRTIHKIQHKNSNLSQKLNNNCQISYNFANIRC